ncbi:galactose 1-dehydrogenase [Croceibacterium mercuriale]|uniref:Galactose 1-dehydrogenase n=1 Tax=Croceibacterium mercuriale TaxID=1572751 RepID=A0A0B2C1X5_9SPHN|nr:Gfo/Idh/MocA family oxidoreductase [Croceibacterium mercuriale]KHL26237.1 galactose 1-dehydrogenase [Croceibacterium mercuriale]
MAAIRLAIVGVGKIARDQHLPAIAADPRFELAALVSRSDAHADGVPTFPTLDALLADGPPVDAVALCTPPQVRYDLAHQALRAGLHVFLEKPPGATVAEVAALQAEADAAGRTLFASWHSRFAAGVERAEAWLADKTITGVTITWREDVRVWHPGQHWIWQAGGLGVFDPGINALSIATQILPWQFFLTEAVLERPANCASPIAARITFRSGDGVPVEADFDFRQTGPQSWDIAVETEAGPLLLREGGAVLVLDGQESRAPDREYPGLYARFAELVEAGRSEADVRPLQLVADAFLRGEIRTVEEFHD